MNTVVQRLYQMNATDWEYKKQKSICFFLILCLRESEWKKLDSSSSYDEY